MRRLVEGQRPQRRPFRRKQIDDLVVEAFDRDTAIRRVKAGSQPDQRLQGIGHAAAVSARVEVLARAGDRELEADQPTARHSQGGFVDSPHGAIGRENEIGRKNRGVLPDELLEMAAPRLFLALDQELDVHRQPAGCREKALNDVDGNEERALVVRHTSPVKPSVAHLRLESIAQPPFERVRRLHVVVPVDQDRWRPRCMGPLAADDRVPAGGSEAHAFQARRHQTLRKPPSAALDIGLERRVGAYAGDARECDQIPEHLVTMPVEVPDEILKHG